MQYLSAEKRKTFKWGIKGEFSIDCCHFIEKGED